MKSASQHAFSMIPRANIPRSVFDRSHGYKCTFDEGWLIPIYCDEALPGDTFRCSTTLFIRLLTPLKWPIMDNMFCDLHFFAVPERLLWNNFKHFMGELDNPDDSTEYALPQIAIAGNGSSVAGGSLLDYMGVPPGVGPIKVRASWARAYNLIYNTWYRDQNYIDSVETNYDSDGDDDPADYVLLKRNKRHDYFTSCLPQPQRGDPVTLPLGGTAPVIGNGTSLGFWDGTTEFGSLAGAAGAMLTDTGADAAVLPFTVPSTPYHPVSSGKAIGVTMAANRSGLVADLSAATAQTINSIRMAFQVQKLLERDARGGTRYIETILSHFGVTAPDFRLQYPEYLGGGSTRINVTPVPQTGGTNAGTGSYQAQLSGYAVGAQGGMGFSKSFTEHCVLLGIMSVRADMTYQQGLPRMWSRRTKYDFYWPALAQIGEQAVLTKEIVCIGDGATTNHDGSTFGYQERYGEYRYFPSQIAGLLRSQAALNLDEWHLAQEFPVDGTMALGQSFIEENPPISRVVAITNQNHFIMDSLFQLHCARPMPVYGVPGLIDHF